MTQTEQPEITGEQKELLFDEKLNGIFRDAAQKSFLKVPELRSVVVVYDFFRNLNDTDGISKGMWLHTDGKAEKPADSIVGSVGATLQALAHMIDEQMQLYASLSNQILELSKTLADKKKEVIESEQI